MIATLPSAAPVLKASCAVEDAAVRRIEAGLRDGAHGARGGEERSETNRRAGAEFRARLQPHPGARDHAERSLRADEHAVGARSGARSGQAARFHHAARRHHAQAFDEIVDMGIEAGEMAARAGRDPAAERGIFEALRKMPQGDAVRLELVLQRRTIDAAFDQRGARGLVDLDDLAEIAQVERDGCLVTNAVGRAARRRRRRWIRRRTASARRWRRRPSPSRRRSPPRCGDRRRRRARNRSRRAWRARSPGRTCRRHAPRGRSVRSCRRRRARRGGVDARRAQREILEARHGMVSNASRENFAR